MRVMLLISTSARPALGVILLAGAITLPAQGPPPNMVGGVLPVTTVHLRQDRPGHWKARASCPHFAGTSPVAQLANRIVAARSRQHVATFIHYAQAHPENRSSNAPYEHRTTATVTLSRRSLVSLYLLEDEFLGGAHGSQTYDPMSFGIVRGRSRRLRLEDLFRPGLPVRRLCADRVLAKLRNTPRAEAVRDGSVTSDKLARGDLKFVITPTGLLFLFDPYQLGSYAAGMFEVPVAFAGFGDALDTSGPLKPLLASRRKDRSAAHRPRGTLPGLQAVSIVLQRAPTHYRFDKSGTVLLDPYGATPLRFLIRNKEGEPVTVSFNALYYRGAKPAEELGVAEHNLKRVVVPSRATRPFIIEVSCKEVKAEPATIVFRVESADKTRFISYTLRYTPDPGSE